MTSANTGSIIPASPELDIANLKGLPEKQQILRILKDYVKLRKRQPREPKADILST